MDGPCNVVLQCGCAAGERCLMGEGDIEMCYATGTDPLDTECPAGTDNCQAQMQCLGTDGVHFYCMQFCYTDDDCPAERTCDVGSPWGGYRICGAAPVVCDVFTGTPCPTGQACIINPPGGATICTTAGTGTAGADCSTVGCVIGTGCYSSDGGVTNTCLQFCDGSHTCTTGTCQLRLGHATIGYCG